MDPSPNIGARLSLHKSGNGCSPINIRAPPRSQYLIPSAREPAASLTSLSSDAAEVQAGWGGGGGHGVGREGAEGEAFLASPPSKSAGDPSPRQGPGSVPSPATSPAAIVGRVLGAGSEPVSASGSWERILLAGLSTHLPALLYIPRVVQPPPPAFFSRGPSQRSTQSPQDLVTAQSRQGKGRRQAAGGHRPWGGACG